MGVDEAHAPRASASMFGVRARSLDVIGAQRVDHDHDDVRAVRPARDCRGRRGGEHGRRGACSSNRRRVVGWAIWRGYRPLLCAAGPACLTDAVIADDLLELLGSRLPGDHARQTRADELAGRALAGRPGAAVLDLGCGAGDSVDLFRRLDPTGSWIGLDVEESVEVAARTRRDAEFATFDGECVPYADGRFDLVYCVQVLEHVRRPGPLLAEAARVLAPGGQLVGSTSQLEPFHSRSTANPTPYGLALDLGDVGLEVLQLRPGIDGLTLILRRGCGGARVFDRWWTRESPLHRAIDLYGHAARLDIPARNAAKLLFCGQFCFLARKPDQLRPSPSGTG